MTSLLFMDLDKAARLKKQKELETIFSTLAEEGTSLCEFMSIWIQLMVLQLEMVFLWLSLSLR